MQEFLPVLPAAKSGILTMYKKNIPRKEEKKWKKEKQAKTQNRQNWSY